MKNLASKMGAVLVLWIEMFCFILLFAFSAKAETVYLRFESADTVVAVSDVGKIGAFQAVNDLGKKVLFLVATVKVTNFINGCIDASRFVPQEKRLKFRSEVESWSYILNLQPMELINLHIYQQSLEIWKKQKK